MSRTTEATRAQGTSLKTVDRRIVIGATRAATPTMSRALKILLPTTLPTARSGVPLRAETTLTQSSGMEVPRATMVSPMTIWGTRSRSATATAPSVSRSAPQRTSTTPTTIHKAFSNILFFLLYFYFFNDVSLGLSVLGRSEIRIRQKAKSVSPMQKYEKTLNAKTFRAHFSLFDYKGKEQATRRGQTSCL